MVLADGEINNGLNFIQSLRILAAEEAFSGVVAILKQKQRLKNHMKKDGENFPGKVEY